MDADHEEREILRQEILQLLRQQMDALDSPFGLTDDQLRECYVRQMRVQELREKLQAPSVGGFRSQPNDAQWNGGWKAPTGPRQSAI